MERPFPKAIWLEVPRPPIPRGFAIMAAADHLRALASFMGQVRGTPAFAEVAAAQHKHWADRLRAIPMLGVQDRKIHTLPFPLWAGV